MSFARAQHRWEQSWIYGPPDDPAEEYIERLGEMTDEQLHRELASVRADLRDPEEFSNMQHLRDSIELIEEEIRERNEDTA